MSAELSPEQLRPVTERSGPWTLSANAGSGKTTVLVERFARAVEEDGVPADKVLAITFTDKAAGELRQRIRERFAERGDRASLRELETGWITTFHGFCARILRLYPLHAGIDPAFVVLDDTDSRALQRDAFDEATGAWLDGAAGQGDAALDLAAVYRGEGLETAIRDVYAAQRSAGAVAPRLPAVAAPGDPAALRAELERTCAAALADLDSEPSAKRVDAAIATLGACADLLAGLPAGELPDVVRCKGLSFNGQAKALQRDPCASYLDAVKRAVAHAATAEAAAVAPLLDDLLARFGTTYAERKRRLGAVDFEDLQLQAVALLRADEAIASSVRRRFSLTMVDEFQDTNGVQLALLRELVQDRENGDLFTVGDPFQSIYGFRHADVSIMEDRRAELGERDRALTLATNYRSRRPILDAVNAIFESQFAGQSFTPLAAGREDAEGEPGRGRGSSCWSPTRRPGRRPSPPTTRPAPCRAHTAGATPRRAWSPSACVS